MRERCSVSWVAIIDNGRILKVGSPAELKAGIG
jgi:ABC-type multidrug transport system ATPase subunit